MQAENTKAILVPKEKIEDIRMHLLKKNILDTNRKIKIATNKDLAEIPVLGEVEGYEHIFQEKPEYYFQFKNLRERLQEIADPEQKKYIPSGWQVLGDVVVITIPEKISSLKPVIGEELLKMYPSCHCVVNDKGIDGDLRQPKREIIAGNGTETTHRENGCVFRMDVTKVMYSKGNLYEKRHMSNIGTGEIIVDMFAGIGYFTIPIAVHAKPEKMYAIELNPESHSYLLENIKLNNVEGIVEPVLGNCLEKAPEGVADRVLMGYVGNTHEYLKKAISILKKEGGIIHYHESVPEKLFPERPVSRITKAALEKGKKVEILGFRRIKKYSPGVWHVVIDAKIG
ncbi:tRNA wybutosine-synthesizing protein 2 [Methanohalophilus levihalophilus]|uniref:class I SAM-dependent methyltransferase n=1 Tax=Methanohalophilus levihalophilus TaxID=1431282 RepID=UPI001AE9C72C|nr:class I SAM-dependent methyltransferase family protein [Methanohalophilus levihalophilus]MBP2029678.1 tRNA wybutosine-synthesizing protein 2 [Methanohalophilus levihalophilus]